MSDRFSTDEKGQVVRFRPRGVPRWRVPTGRTPQRNPLVDDLAKYERTPAEDDFRHRMKVNALAFLTTVLLAFIGLWIANRIAGMVEIQDCVLSGRHNCVRIDAGPKSSQWVPTPTRIGLSGNVERDRSQS